MGFMDGYTAPSGGYTPPEESAFGQWKRNAIGSTKEIADVSQLSDTWANNTGMGGGGNSPFSFDTSKLTGGDIPGASGSSFMDGLLGKTMKDGSKTMGWGGLALGVANTGLNTWLGMKQLDAAEDQLAFQKNSFNKNYAAQKTTANEQLNWRNTFRKQTNPDYDKPAPQIA